MDGHELMSFVNVAIGGAAVAAYGMWAGKWLSRRVWHLFLLNAISAGIIGGFTLGYAAILSEASNSLWIEHVIVQYLVVFIIGLPTIARLAEYRRDQAREWFSRRAVRELVRDTNAMA